MKKSTNSALFPNHVKWVNHLLFTIKASILVFFILVSSNLNAQFNCPNANRCTSKDLSIVGAFLTGGQCFCSATGTQTATLNMSINNTTGSWRTSFAFFGTLVKTNPDGTTQTSSLSGCGGPLPPNTTTSIVVNNSITYNCNQTLSLTNVYLAWTDASGAQEPNGPATRCAEILADACAHIAPKCGTAPVVPIAPLLSASSTTTAGCTGASAGKIKINPIGGVSPYTVVLKKGAATVATQNNVTSSGYEFTGLVEGTDYTAVVTDSRTPTACSYTTGAITLGSVFCCTPPSVGNNPSNAAKCAGEPASFVASASGGNPPPSTKWQAKPPAGAFADIVGPGAFSGFATNTLSISDVTGLNGYQFRAIFTSTDCAPATSNPATLTVNALPGNPDVTYNPPACDETTFSITVGSNANPVIEGAKYTVLDKNGDPIPGISPASPHTATAQEATNKTIVFGNIPAGSGYNVSIESAAGCVPSSSALACGTADARLADQSRKAPSVVSQNVEAQTTVKAYPNPFSDRIKFVVTSSVGGNGILDVYNMTGQKVKTVHKGYIAAGTQTFELSLPTQQVANLVYVLRVGDKKTSGKILQINR